jgi:hypothetical protein
MGAIYINSREYGCNIKFQGIYTNSRDGCNYGVATHVYF